MFSGITNLDFNSTFAQLTSSLNLDLDSLQSENGAKKDDSTEGKSNVEQKKEEGSAVSAVPVVSTNVAASAVPDSRSGGAVEEKFQARIQKLQQSVDEKDHEINGLRAMVAMYENKLTTLHATKAVCQVCVEREQQQSFVEEASQQDIQPTTPTKNSEEDDGANAAAYKKSAEESEKRLKKFQKRVKDLDVEIKKLNENNATLSNQLQESEENSKAIVKSLQKQVETLTTANEALSSNAADSSSLQKKILSLQQELETLASNQNQLEQEKYTWQQHYDEEKKVVERLEGRLREQEERNRKLVMERDAMQEKVSALQDQGGTLSSVLDVQQGKVEDAENRAHYLKQQLDTLQQRIKEFEQSNKVLEERLVKKDNALQQSTKTQQELQVDHDKKCDQVKDLEGKVAQLTDKLKDLMQRFAELKQKYTQSESQVEQVRQDDEKILQSKESEVVKARLKLERVEQQLDESKTRCQEISEKYADTQRHLTELKQSHQQLSEAHSQCLEAKTQLEHELSEKQGINSDYEDKLIRMKNQYSAELQEKEEKLVQLTADFHILQQQSKNSMETGDMLDDYKKRAQIALKKANASIAKLTEDNEALQSTLSNVKQELLEAKQSLAALEDEKAKLLTESVVAKKTLEESQRRIAEGSSHLTKQIESLQKVIVEKEAEIERLEQVQQQQAVHTEAHQAQALETLLTGETDIFPVEKVAPTVASPLTIADSNSQHGSATLSPNTSHHNLAAESSSSPSKQEVSSSSDTTIPTSSESAKGSGQYMLVNELQQQLQELKKDLAQRGIEREDLHRQLGQEHEEKEKLQARCDELMAYLARLKKSHEEDPNSAVNLEYLKNCVFKYMSTKEVSERRRLFRVIGVILTFTGKEMKQIEDCLSEEESAANQINQTITTIGSSLEGWFGSGFMK